MMWMSRLALCLALWTGPGLAQETQPPVGAGAPATPTLSLRTTLVQVPVSLRTKAGEPVFTLQASDFLVTDDGVEQVVRLEDELDAQPLALVVVVEAGDTPGSKFADYAGLGRMLDALAGGAPALGDRTKLAVIGFDSQPEVVQPWTGNVDKAQTALARIETGDGGASTLDALTMAVALLRTQPVAYRRAILLVSETVDRGSHVRIGAALRAVSDTNTVIYSLGYSSARATGKAEAIAAVSSPEDGPPHGCMGKYPDVDLEGNPLPPPANAYAQGSHAHSKAVQAYDCLSLLAPPLRLAKAAVLAAIDGFHTNVPETAAKLSGGEYFHVEGAKGLEKDLVGISNRLPNRYFLSFRPTASHPGLHAIGVSLREQRPGVVLRARTSYWEEETK